MAMSSITCFCDFPLLQFPPISMVKYKNELGKVCAIGIWSVAIFHLVPVFYNSYALTSNLMYCNSVASAVPNLSHWASLDGNHLFAAKRRCAGTAFLLLHSLPKSLLALFPSISISCAWSLHSILYWITSCLEPNRLQAVAHFRCRIWARRMKPRCESTKLRFFFRSFLNCRIIVYLKISGKYQRASRLFCS